jgi:aspartyl-tRNA(Asn)/glutamyl-tRNA(Gln) amidotransferase subunit B
MNYDPERRRTRVLRLKENADDYRYFDDPDLIPLVIAGGLVEAVRESLPELPDQKRLRFEGEYGLPEDLTGILIASRSLADYFEKTAEACSSARKAAIWIARDLRQELNGRGIGIEDVELEATALARLIDLVEEGRLTARNARELLPELIEGGGDPEAMMVARGLEAVSDSAGVDGFVRTVIAENEEAVASVRGGDDKPLNFLMGQVMKASQGKANPAEVRKRLIEIIRGDA